MPPIKYPVQEAERLAAALKGKSKAMMKLFSDEWHREAGENEKKAVLEQFASFDAQIRRICERAIG